MTGKIDFLLSKDFREEAQEITSFIEGLDENEKNSFFVFVQGAKFGKTLTENKDTA